MASHFWSVYCGTSKESERILALNYREKSVRYENHQSTKAKGRFEVGPNLPYVTLQIMRTQELEDNLDYLITNLNEYKSASFRTNRRRIGLPAR